MGSGLQGDSLHLTLTVPHLFHSLSNPHYTQLYLEHPTQLIQRGEYKRQTRVRVLMFIHAHLNISKAPAHETTNRTRSVLSSAPGLLSNGPVPSLASY